MDKKPATVPPAGEDYQMLLGELAAVRSRREAAGRLHDHLSSGTDKEGPYTVGLALSGGGIRSATVSLGIMQKLAGAGLLKHVDFLSTVSGGGFIGSALTWWLRDNARDKYDTDTNFPFGTRDPKLPEPKAPNAPNGDPQLTPLQFLRGQGNYLVPGNGLTIWSAIAIVTRAILINLLVWIPVTALLMGVLYAFGKPQFMKDIPFAVRGILEKIAGIVGTSGQIDPTQTIPPVFLLMLVAAVLLFALFVLATINHSLLTWTNLTESDEAKRSARATKAREKKNWYSWPLAALVTVAGLALVAFTVLWMLPAVTALFAEVDSTDRPAMPDLMSGIIQWAIVLAAAVLSTFLIGGLKWKSLTNRQQRPVARAVLGLLMILVCAYIADRFIPNDRCTLCVRFPETLLFIFVVAYITFTVYLAGLLIRHFLRAQAVGNQKTEMRSATPSLIQYGARRVFEWFFGRVLFIIVALLVVGSLPLVNHYIHYGLGGVGTALGLAITFAGNILSRVRGNSRLTEITIIAGAALFTYSILLLGHLLALTFMEGQVVPRALIAGAIIAALIVGWFVNTNQIGLHRFYRDRLMEAFLPDAESLQSDANAAATAANERKLTECWNGTSSTGPYQIINTNVVLTNSLQRKYRLRGGDSFILTPKYIGSSATGWHLTEKTANSDITLASAMAISGAAANPRGAAGGRGLTRSTFVSLAMSLLNVRLGYWIPNPSFGLPTMLPRRPNHFWPGGFYALAGRGYRESSKWLEIADGGHFENLAVYELVRRRCGLIIVCDGGQDNASSYSDMVTAVQRIGQDFGATVHFDMQVSKSGNDKFEDTGPAQMIASDKMTDYPKGAEFAEKGYFVARIDYGSERGSKGWPKTGILIYLKSALILDLAIGAKGYRGAHHDFPNESTSDQFFDEEQFDAYREVGYRICEQMVAELDLATLFTKRPPRIADLWKTGRFQIKKPT